MPAPTVQLFSNPRSGSYTRHRIEALAHAFESAGAQVVQSESAHSPPTIAEGVTHVCVAGGDGTVRHVAGAIAQGGHAVSLSIYPAGTVNLLAMEAGYPTDPHDFARMALTDQPSRRHYPVRIGTGYFFACAGVGPDSLAVARVTAARKRRLGRFAYAIAAAELLINWRRYEIQLGCDGGTLTCEAFYVAKGRYYAGRWSLASAARGDTPLLHVVALTTARRHDYLRFIWTLLRGKETAQLPGVRTFTCTHLTASSAHDLPLQADGDIVGWLPSTIELDARPLVMC